MAYRVIRAGALLFLLFASNVNAQTTPASISNVYEEQFSVGYVNFSGSSIIDATVGKWDFGTKFFGENSTLNIDIDVNDGGIVFFDYFAESNDATSFSVLLIPPAPQLTQVVVAGFTPSIVLPTPVRRINVDLNAYRNQTITFQFVTSYPLVSNPNANIFQGRAVIEDFQVATCPVPPLMPLTDPDAIAFENGARINTDPQNFSLGTELSCLTTRVSNLGGGSTLTSAYRPAQYQQHLREVFFAQNALKNIRSQECAVIKADVQSEFNQHQIIRAPARTSNHTRGLAFDLSISGLTSSQIDAQANLCGLRRFDPIGDPVHFTR